MMFFVVMAGVIGFVTVVLAYIAESYMRDLIRK